MDLNDIEVFLAVAEARSFTAAGAALRLDKARVSRVVARLEAVLGVKLLARSTRVVRLTAEGEALAARAGPHLLGLKAAAQAAGGEAPEGRVVLATTHDVGRHLLAPVLPRFRAQYPGVGVELRVEARAVDLLAEGVDLALRVGRVASPSHVARKVMDLEAGFFASPGYLALRGVPQEASDLARHDGLWPAPPGGKRPFGAPGRRPGPAAVGCDDFAVLAAVARSSGGVALLPTFVARDDVASGALVRVLPQLTLGQAPLVLLSRPERAPRVEALRRFLPGALRAAAGR